jgi:hypothetical protein
MESVAFVVLVIPIGALAISVALLVLAEAADWARATFLYLASRCRKTT